MEKGATPSPHRILLCIANAGLTAICGLCIANKGLSPKLDIALHPRMAQCNLAAGRVKWHSSRGTQGFRAEFGFSI
jgi:hypothetical protein